MSSWSREAALIEDAIARELLTQLLALIAFFAFPVIQYTLLKMYSRREGRPEIWYIPSYQHFRLVIRNIPGNKTLSDIKYRAIIRDVVLPNDECSVTTWPDRTIVEREDFFLFPESDQLLLCFRLEHGDTALNLVHTDKLGKTISRLIFPQTSLLLVDYSANLENLFNFDVRLAKRVEIPASELAHLLDEIQKNNEEQKFIPKCIRDVG